MSPALLAWVRFFAGWFAISGLWLIAWSCPEGGGEPIYPRSLAEVVLVGFIGAVFLYVLRNWGRWRRPQT
jgi:uncharacterized RDD family membrane protein YckC